MQVSHKAVYPPQEKNPKGEIHEDAAFLSFDRGREEIRHAAVSHRRLREPLCAGTYQRGRAHADLRHGAIENIPPGWRGRETYRFASDDEFTETFELAAPGKDFTVYSVARFTRKK